MHQPCLKMSLRCACKSDGRRTCLNKAKLRHVGNGGWAICLFAYAPYRGQRGGGGRKQGVVVVTGSRGYRARCTILRVGLICKAFTGYAREVGAAAVTTGAQRPFHTLRLKSWRAHEGRARRARVSVQMMIIEAARRRTSAQRTRRPSGSDVGTTTCAACSSALGCDSTRAGAQAVLAQIVYEFTPPAAMGAAVCHQ